MIELEMGERGRRRVSSRERREQFTLRKSNNDIPSTGNKSGFSVHLQGVGGIKVDVLSKIKN